MYPNMVLFNNACADGDLEYVKNNIKNISHSQMDFGFRLAATYNHVDIVSFLLDSNELSVIASNCSTQEDNAFMSSFSLKRTSNKVTEYLLKQRKYIPTESILFWIEENNIKFDTTPYWK